ncbi:vanadium-dependent haloperoxidase [Epibacterium sp. MM17-32]|uniref:vanadium-dependent haloperoxidase n=1 Tax=Epibacterium sp. MM17-32 TaxID=2917734 RepID=UPI001EF6B42F|nr:vanadium-dependent haloperoxidase [Epibacterium sp. MM17-32]MCG7630003.1 vanadium-dependent haloperoxidase [Epibacterium sp. MM17-32]
MNSGFQKVKTLLFCSAVATLASAPLARAEMASDLQDSVAPLLIEAKWTGAERQRTLTILHLAMFDAANATQGLYTPYAYEGEVDTSASAEAAVAQAALSVMSELMPEKQQDFEAMAAAYFDTAGDEAAREAGRRLGSAAAAAVLAVRAEDGADFSLDFTPAKADAGVYQPTSERAMVAPKIKEMTPFVLTSATHFRVPPPPSLDSAQYKQGLLEVVTRGGKDSPATPEEIEIAKLHAGSGSGAWNQLARNSSRACALPLLEETRMLALLNVALTDALIAGFNAKYSYALWRPQTAVEALGTTYSHPDLEAGMTWESRIPAPMHPEYPCQHCTSGSAALEVMTSVFGAEPFPIRFEGAANLSKDYDSLQQFAEEESESRLIGGVHYRRSNAVGDMLGYQIGHHVAHTALQPVTADAAPQHACEGFDSTMVLQ